MNEIRGTNARGASTPDPYVDRGALSEAWYRALYGAHGRPGTIANARGTAAARPQAHAASEDAADRRGAGTPAAASAGKNASAARPARTVAIVRADAARAVRDAAPRRAAPPPATRDVARGSSCTLAFPDGRELVILIRRRGARVRVVAVVDDARAAHVAHAMHRARAALAAHGLSLDTELRSKGTS